MSRRAILDRERRWAPWAAAASFVPVVAYLAALAIESNAGLELGGLLPSELRSVDENSGSLLIATIVRSIGFLAMAFPLIYLFKAAQARSDRVSGVLLGFAVLGPVLLAVQGIVTWVAQTDIANQFVEQSPGVGDVYSLAENLLEESSSRQIASAMLFAGILALIFAFVYTPLWSVRTGLLTRFFGTLGMALGASLLFILQIALLALLGWLVYLGLIILGRTPGVRPPAWDVGEAVPWPSPGQEPVAPAAGTGDVIEGDASEIPGVEEGGNSNAARRERARKRKRKRRR